jgi:cyclic pyranopterin phosphate synthase
MSGPLTHFDATGAAHMVDVSGKDISARTAVARGFVRINAATMELVRQGTAKKGDVLGTARLAGIMAAKKCADLIPLCHPLPLSHVALTLTPTQGGVAVEAMCKTTGQTGVEMEALTAVSVACLTIYDMLKAAQKDMVIEGICVTLKEGGTSGRYSL